MDDARLCDRAGAGTQTLILMAGELIAGPPSEFSRALLMGAAWVINLAVAEWIIRKRRPLQPARYLPFTNYCSETAPKVD